MARPPRTLHLPQRSSAPPRRSPQSRRRLDAPLRPRPAGPPPRPYDHIIFAPIDNPRAANIEDLLAAAHALDIPAHAAPHLAAALAQARAITPPNGLIIATGSVYLVGEIRHLAVQQ